MPHVSARSQLGLTAAVAFFVTVLGSNGPTPLFPQYVRDIGLSQLQVGVAFSAYFFGLVAALFTLSGSRLSRIPQVVLPCALILTATADVIFVVMDEQVWLLHTARVCTGAAVGFATGPSATFALAALGERGRSMITTVAMLAASTGLGFSMLVVELLPSPRTTIFEIHAVLSAVVVLLLLAALVRGRSLWRESVRLTAPRSLPERSVDNPPRTVFLAYLAGALGWIVGAFAVGIVPTVLVVQDSDLSLVLAAVPGLACLTAAALFQLSTTAVGRRMPLWASMFVLAAGAALTAVGLVTSSLLVTTSGCVLFGIGQSPSYSGGFRILAQGLMPLRQGRFASRYSGFCYLAAGVFVFVTGALGSAMGVAAGTVVATVLFGLVCTGLGTYLALIPLERSSGVANSAFSIETADVSACRSVRGEQVNLLNRSGTHPSSM